VRELQQQEVASRAGVSLATIRRFEKTGQATLENALRIANALGVGHQFEGLFVAPPYRTLDEAMDRPALLERKRVRRRR
jgi:transcriptional regulator with XRE-family HTH domain